MCCLREVLKLIKETLTKIRVGRACRGSTHTLSLLINYPKQEDINYRLQQEDVSYRFQQEETYLAAWNRKYNYSSRRKEDFLLAQQQAQSMENATAQSVEKLLSLELYFPPMNFHFFLADDFLSLSPSLCYKRLPCCVTPWSISLPATCNAA